MSKIKCQTKSKCQNNFKITNNQETKNKQAPNSKHQIPNPDIIEDSRQSRSKSQIQNN